LKESPKVSETKPATVVAVLEECPLSDGVDTPSDLAKDDEGLTGRQRRFVEALVSNGGKRREAAETAGYAPGPGAGVAATRALRLPQVQEAILRRTRELRVAALIPAMATMQRLLRSKSDYVKLEAASRLIDGALKETKPTAGKVTVSFDLG
jgi:phage terminase small subunit